MGRLLLVEGWGSALEWWGSALEGWGSSLVGGREGEPPRRNAGRRKHSPWRGRPHAIRRTSHAIRGVRWTPPVVVGGEAVVAHVASAPGRPFSLVNSRPPACLVARR